MIDWLSMVLRPRQHSIGYTGDSFTGQKTQPTVSKYWRNKKYTNNTKLGGLAVTRWSRSTELLYTGPG